MAHHTKGVFGLLAQREAERGFTELTEKLFDDVVRTTAIPKSIFMSGSLGVPWDEEAEKASIEFTGADVQGKRVVGIHPTRGAFDIKLGEPLRVTRENYDLNLNTDELDRALGDYQKTTAPIIKQLEKSMNEKAVKAIARAIDSGKAVVTNYSMRNDFDDFPSFVLEGKHTDFGGNGFFDFDDEGEKTKPKKALFKMKDPNNNPIVHEVARDLVKTETEKAKHAEKVSAATQAREDARNAAEEARDEADAILREAQERAAALIKSADDAHVAAREALAEANKGSEELEARLEENRAALHVARESADEDIELVIGSHVVRARETSEGTEVSCTNPAKVKKTPAS